MAGMTKAEQLVCEEDRRAGVADGPGVRARLMNTTGGSGAVRVHHRSQCLGGSWPAGNIWMRSAVIMKARRQLRHPHLPKGWKPSRRCISVLRHRGHAFTS